MNSVLRKQALRGRLRCENMCVVSKSKRPNGWDVGRRCAKRGVASTFAATPLAIGLILPADSSNIVSQCCKLPQLAQNATKTRPPQLRVASIRFSLFKVARPLASKTASTCFNLLQLARRVASTIASACLNLLQLARRVASTCFNNCFNSCFNLLQLARRGA